MLGSSGIGGTSEEKERRSVERRVSSEADLGVRLLGGIRGIRALATLCIT